MDENYEIELEVDIPETENDVKHSIRCRAWRRTMRRNHIARKRKISNKIYYGGWHCPDGALSKGKIHCSCWLCSFHGTPIQDLKRLDAMRYGLKEEI